MVFHPSEEYFEKGEGGRDERDRGQAGGGERGGVEESEASARTNAHPFILIGTCSAASLRQRGRLPRPLPEGMLLSYSLFPSFMSSRSYHSSSYSQIPRHSLSMTPLLFGLISARSFTGRNPGRRRVRREGERKGWLNVEHVSCGLTFQPPTCFPVSLHLPTHYKPLFSQLLRPLSPPYPSRSLAQFQQVCRSCPCPFFPRRRNQHRLQRPRPTRGCRPR